MLTPFVNGNNLDPVPPARMIPFIFSLPYLAHRRCKKGAKPNNRLLVKRLLRAQIELIDIDKVNWNKNCTNTKISKCPHSL